MNKPVWTTACPDWEKRIVAGESLIPFDPLFPSEAEAALAVFKGLRVVDVPGSPTFGECCKPWVFDFVAAIFGAQDPEIGKRLISEFLLLIAKKNAKSTIAAGIMVTALVRNWRPANELLLLAPTIEVANNSYGPASKMVRADEELNKLIHIQDHLRTLTHRRTEAELKIVSADSNIVSGKKAGFVLIDELWLFGKKADAAAMLQEATGGLASKPEGFIIKLTTHSDELPSGVWKSDLEYFRDVRDGKIVDPNRLPVLYEYPSAMLDAEEYLDPRNFYITNPNLGKSVSQEWLEDKLRRIQSGGTDAEAGDKQTFLAKHLNVQIGTRTRRDAWAGAKFWDQAVDQELAALETYEERVAYLIAKCGVLVVGVDGGGLDDFLSMTVVGRLLEDRNTWLAVQHSWADESSLEQRKSEAPKFRDFEAAGELTIVNDLADAFADLAARTAWLYASGKLARFGIDPAGVTLIIDEIAKADLPTELPFLTGVRQGWQLQGAVKAAEVKVRNRTLRHAGENILSWAVGNAKAETHGNALWVTKQAAGTMKVDPLMSVFDAVALMGLNPEVEDNSSVYEKRGMYVFG